MNRDLVKVIERNIENLRFSLEFDRFDFTREQRESMLFRLGEIRKIVDEVKSKE